MDGKGELERLERQSTKGHRRVAGVLGGTSEEGEGTKEVVGRDRGVTVPCVVANTTLGGASVEAEEAEREPNICLSVLDQWRRHCLEALFVPK
jgi:hypothetical protein